MKCTEYTDGRSEGDNLHIFKGRQDKVLERAMVSLNMFVSAWCLSFKRDTLPFCCFAGELLCEMFSVMVQIMFFSFLEG